MALRGELSVSRGGRLVFRVTARDLEMLDEYIALAIGLGV